MDWEQMYTHNREERKLLTGFDVEWALSMMSLSQTLLSPREVLGEVGMEESVEPKDTSNSQTSRSTT